MKNLFFTTMLLAIPAAIVGYLLFLVGRQIWVWYGDWRLEKELDVIQSESEKRRDQRREEGTRRLDNGCQHAFDSALGGFPPGVCPKCGLARERPTGPCDHVWRRKEGPVLASCCEKCGKEYRPG